MVNEAQAGLHKLLQCCPFRYREGTGDPRSISCTLSHSQTEWRHRAVTSRRNTHRVLFSVPCSTSVPPPVLGIPVLFLTLLPPLLFSALPYPPLLSSSSLFSTSFLLPLSYSICLSVPPSFWGQNVDMLGEHSAIKSHPQPCFLF